MDASSLLMQRMCRLAPLHASPSGASGYISGFSVFIGLVLEYSGKPQLHVVGISSGGAVILLAASQRPDLKTKITNPTSPSVASAVLWAPSINMGTAQDVVYQLSQLLPITQSFSGPVTFTFMFDQISGFFQSLCSTDHRQRNLCSRLVDFLLGFSGTQAPARQSILSSVLLPTSYHELAHLGQFARTERPCKLNFNDPKKNLEVYGRSEPPCYDLSRVKLDYISIYAGNKDRLVSPGSVDITRSQLGVESKLTLIDEEGILFNHGGFITHDQTDRLVLVPSLLDFERAKARLPRK